MADDNNVPKKLDIPAAMRHRMVVTQPKLSARWSKTTTIPDNDFLPDDAEVGMIVEADYPVSRPKAEISVVYHDDQNSAIAGVFGLKLDNKKVVDADGAAPTRLFSFDDNIYTTWNRLDYDFFVKIDNAQALTSNTLRVKRWHVHAVDIGDTRPAILAFRAQEKSNQVAVYATAADDQSYSWSFDAGNTAKGDFGGAMKSCYSFVYTGHGAVMCGTCGAMYSCISDTGPDFGKWTHCSTDASHDDPISTHCIGAAPYFQGSDVANEATVPVVPKYLIFSVCCGGGYEASLFQAYLDRGTKYAIGFRKSTRCDWARDYAKDFFSKWVGDHGCDPDKIPTVYYSLYSEWQPKLDPRIFGADDNWAKEDSPSIFQTVVQFVQKIISLF